MTKLVLGGLLCSCFIASGQVGTGPGETTILSTFDRVALTRGGKNSIQGDKYFEEEIKLASIYIDGKKIRRSFVRYNALRDELEVTEVFKVSKADNVKVVVDEGYSYKVLDYNGMKHFFIFLKEGKNSLLMKIEKTVKIGKDAVSGYEGAIPDKYVEKRNYFIQKQNGELVAVKLKKKSILQAFEDKKEQIETFVSKKGLNYKKEEDLMRIVSHYNAL